MHQLQLRRNMAIFAFNAAASAGHATIPKLGAVLPIPLGQVRWPLALVATIGVVLANHKPERISTRGLTLLLCGLCTFLAIHAGSFGVGQIRFDYIVDLVHLAILGLLAFFLLRDEEDLTVFCSALIVIALPFIPVWYWRNPETFTAFTTITYYRIEFFAFAGCMYFAFQGRKLGWIGAAMFLFCTFDSTSKAAVTFAPLSVAYMCIVLAIRRSITTSPFWNSALAPLALLVLVTAIFVPTRSATVVSRIESVSALTPVPTMALTPVPTTTLMPPPTTASASASADMEDRRLDAKTKNNLFTFNDATQRVRLAVKAFELFKVNPFRGVGIGRYSLDLLNSSSDGFETYRYPHNATFEVLYSTGLLGLVIYGTCAIVFLISLHRKMLHQINVAAIGCGAIFALLTSHFAGDFYDMRMFWVLILAAQCAMDANRPPALHLSQGKRQSALKP